MMARNAFGAESCLVAEFRPSPNHGERKDGRRPDMILLHYTGMPEAGEALERLCSQGSEVSAHYFVFEDGRIVQMVLENRRAWHAGESVWAGETDINSCSIDYGYVEFPKRQIAAVTALCRGIQTRHNIQPTRVLGHSDVAPARKRDPGERFPWRTLWDSGVGHWAKPAPIKEGGQLLALGDRGDAVSTMQDLLSQYGYSVVINGIYDSVMYDLVSAFQRHFRQERVDGVTDDSTRTTLRDLLATRGRVRTIAGRTRDLASLAP
jgi:N-acetylmuramoyl-L-alanine amidase